MQMCVVVFFNIFELLPLRWSHLFLSASEPGAYVWQRSVLKILRFGLRSCLLEDVFESASCLVHNSTMLGFWRLVLALGLKSGGNNHFWPLSCCSATTQAYSQDVSLWPAASGTLTSWEHSASAKTGTGRHAWTWYSKGKVRRCQK